jgi:repressor LexA
MKGLTQRQSEVLQFVEHFIDQHEYSPSYREIMTRFGFSSVGSVYKHIQALKRKGFLENEEGCSRSLVLAEKDTPSGSGTTVDLPFMGQFSAGNPIETFPSIDLVSVPDRMVSDPDSTYILQAAGNSLLAEFIADGDLLLVEARPYAEDGETVIATLGHEETILRRYILRDDTVSFESASHGNDPILAPRDEVTIQGVVVGLLRAY